jgi:S-DNA-T family DNA segregation ATPase FtsK/SpoIIIE
VDTISHAIQHEIIMLSDVRQGLYFEISDDSTVRGIPASVWATELSAPLDAAPLAYVAGISRRGAIVADLESMPSLILGGATRQGKSIHLWHITVTLATRNSPQSLRLAMFDLKDGTMFFPFRNLPHLLFPVVDTPGKALSAMNILVEEMHKRYELFKTRGQATREHYNALESVTDKLPAIVCVIDELASLTQTKDQNLKEAERALVLLLRQGAAAGIHFVIATQNPRSEVVNSDIRANVPEAMAFRCAKRSHSEIIIGRGGAEKIQGKGRALFKFGADIIEVQTPRIMEEGGKHGIYQLVSHIIQKWDEAETRQELVDALPKDDRIKQEMLDYALKHLGGDFPTADLCKAFAGRVSQKRVKKLAQELEQAGILSPGGPGKRRKIIAAKLGQVEANQAVLQSLDSQPADLTQVSMHGELLSDDEAVELFKPAVQRVEVIDA